MKSAKKKKLVKALDRLSTLVEKCGGPGGTPGPCPSGQGKPDAGHVKTKAAHDASMAAHKATSSATTGNSGPWNASTKARMHADNASVMMKYVGDKKQAIQSHADAAKAHGAAWKEHTTAAKTAPDAAKHHEAARLHEHAGALHEKARQHLAGTSMNSFQGI